MTSKEWKDKGNAFVKEKKYQDALDCYTKAIDIDPNDPVLYSNRSAMESNLGKFDKALEDAEKAISLKQDYVKAYLRKGTALNGLNKIDEAKASFEAGLKIDPNNNQLKDELNKIEEQFKNPFLKNYNKLFTDPRTSEMMKDPQFKNLIDYGMKDQKMFLQLIQTDPRMMTVFSVLTGIDLEAMNKAHMEKEKQNEEEERKKREEKEKEEKIKEEEAKKKAEEERFNNLSEEEKKDELLHREADEIKKEGNKFYLSKDFDNAMKKYQEAIEKYPKELTYKLNISKCYMEKHQYDDVIKTCKEIIENTTDFVKRATAYALIGYAYKNKGDINACIENFERSQLENNDIRIKDALKEAYKEKKKQEELAYINPEKAEEENAAGNELYKASKFPEAIKKYEEAIRRNPKIPKYYANKAACYIKLGEFQLGVEACDEAIKVDPNYSKAYNKKISCHITMKQYFKAMEWGEKAMKLFPEDKEIKELYNKTMMLINMSSGDNDQERAARAAQDPEIQQLLKDPRVQQLFKYLKENPQMAQECIMKDEYLRDAMKKLIAAGIVKTK